MMRELLLLVAQLRVKAEHIENDVRQFFWEIPSQYSDPLLSGKFAMLLFSANGSPQKFAQDYVTELNSDLFEEWAILRVAGRPYTYRDLVPRKKSIEEGGYAFKDDVWSSRLRNSFDTNTAETINQTISDRDPILKLMWLQTAAQEAVKCPEIRKIRQQFGRDVSTHFPSDYSVLLALKSRYSVNELCKTLSSSLISENVTDFVCFDIDFICAGKHDKFTPLCAWIDKQLPRKVMSFPQRRAANQRQEPTVIVKKRRKLNNHN